MIKNENTLSKLLICIAIIFTLLFGYSYFFTDQLEIYHGGFLILFLVNILTLAYKQSNIFNKKNDIKNLIRREGSWLVCQSTSISSPSIIVIDKIGEITISKNYLSFIEVGNGQGYDFEVKGRANDITTHLYELLNPDEINEMKLVIV